MHPFKDPFCLANPLGSYLWKFSGPQNVINKCVVLDIHLCAFGSHWRTASRLVFGGQSDRACCHSLYSYFDVTVERGTLLLREIGFGEKSSGAMATRVCTKGSIMSEAGVCTSAARPCGKVCTSRPGCRSAQEVMVRNSASARKEAADKVAGLVRTF